jgi:hypothetical protein
VGPSKDAKPIFQNYNFNNILQFIEYQTESTVFPLQYALSVPYAFVKNMGEEEEYASVTVSGGFLKKYELNIGNPAPSLMLFYDNIGMGGCPNASSVNCDAILYSESAIHLMLTNMSFLHLTISQQGRVWLILSDSMLL